jgi:hypothetical protein
MCVRSQEAEALLREAGVRILRLFHFMYGMSCVAWFTRQKKKYPIIQHTTLEHTRAARCCRDVRSAHHQIIKKTSSQSQRMAEMIVDADVINKRTNNTKRRFSSFIRSLCHRQDGTSMFHNFVIKLAFLSIVSMSTYCQAFTIQPMVAFTGQSRHARVPLIMERQTKHGVTTTHTAPGVVSELLSPGTTKQQQHQTTTNTCLFMNQQGGNNQQFDLTKPTFDVLSLRQVPTDVLLQYDATNQSEPLRITLCGIRTLGSLVAPTLAEPFLDAGSSMIPVYVGCAVSSVASAALFVRECVKRNQQLVRLEKERAASSLMARIPDGLGNLQSRAPKSLRQLTRDTGRRVLVVGGNKADLTNTLNQALLGALRQRLAQASVTVVAVGLDGSTRADWNLDWSDGIQGKTWLAEPHDPQSWKAYLNDLVSLNNGNDSNHGNDKSDNRNDGSSPASPPSSTSNNNSLVWFGLNARGRSVGSGAGEAPRLLELLGSFFPPVDFLDKEEDTIPKSLSEEQNAVLQAQTDFYKALTTGDKATMLDKVFAATVADPATNLLSLSKEVSEVVNAGGRLEDWDACLADGSRPEGMLISGCDVSVVSDTEAYTTAIEFPKMDGASMAMAGDATLLAIQKWSRVSKSTSSDNNDNTDSTSWKLVLHQTIPWSLGSKAAGTLRCDCRGCVALSRGSDRRTFGGLIG